MLYCFVSLVRTDFKCIALLIDLGDNSHAYNKGRALVFSKVPLPDYRADLDDRHGSTQKEVICLFLQ